MVGNELIVSVIGFQMAGATVIAGQSGEEKALL